MRGRESWPEREDMTFRAVDRLLQTFLGLVLVLVAEVLGEHVFDFFLRNKRAEWEQYRREVTPYERERYLGAL